MKKLTALLLLLSMCVQSYAITAFGNVLEFPAGVKEWSKPVEGTIQSKAMQKDGIEPVKVSVRARVVRNIFRGCRYEVEVRNIDSRGVRFELFNNGKYKKIKLDPNESEVVGIDTFLNKNCPDAEGCGNNTCEYDIDFYEVKVSK